MINAQMMPSMLPMGGSKTPFSLSGSWETGNDGWAIPSQVGRIQFAARTGSWAMYFTFSDPGMFDITQTIPAEIAGRMIISASVYSRTETASGAATREIAYRIGSGSYTTLQSVSAASTSYALLSGAFNNPGDDDITIRIRGQRVSTPYFQQSLFDDWSISGEPL